VQPFPSPASNHNAVRVRRVRALAEGIKTASLAVLVYLCALPFLLLAGFGLVIMFVATGYLLGREYFLLAAMRFRTPDEAKALRRSQRGSVFLAGLLIAIFVSIPVVNLATPLFAMALMVHMHKRLSGRRIELIEPKRRPSQ
jgi:CysZ protein